MGPSAGTSVPSLQSTNSLIWGIWGRITNGPLSTTFLIYARSASEGPPSKGLTAFLVERDSKGFEVGEHLDKFGVRSRLCGGMELMRR